MPRLQLKIQIKIVVQADHLATKTDFGFNEQNEHFELKKLWHVPQPVQYMYHSEILAKEDSLSSRAGNIKHSGQEVVSDVYEVT